jgi:hypothetical protein
VFVLRSSEYYEIKKTRITNWVLNRQQDHTASRHQKLASFSLKNLDATNGWSYPARSNPYPPGFEQTGQDQTMPKIL